mgnify:CR=1 FL=1
MKNSWKKVVAMMIAAALCVSCGVTGFSEDIQTDESTGIVEVAEAQNQEEPPKEEAPAQEPAPAPEPVQAPEPVKEPDPAPVQEPEPVKEPEPAPKAEEPKNEPEAPKTEEPKAEPEPVKEPEAPKNEAPKQEEETKADQQTEEKLDEKAEVPEQKIEESAEQKKEDIKADETKKEEETKAETKNEEFKEESKTEEPKAEESEEESKEESKEEKPAEQPTVPAAKAEQPVEDAPAADVVVKENITVCIEWEDEDDALGLRPQTRAVTLNGSDGQTYSATLAEKDGWQHTFADLTTQRGAEVIYYSVDADDVADYDKDVRGLTVTYTCTAKPVAEEEPVIDEQPVAEDENLIDDQMDGEQGELPEGDLPTVTETEDGTVIDMGETAEEPVEGEEANADKIEEDGELDEDFVLPEEGELPAEDAEPEIPEIDFSTLSVAISAESDVVELGGDMVLTAVLTGFEDLNYTLQWQFSTDNENWADVDGATGSTLRVQMNEENRDYFWRVSVDNISWKNPPVVQAEQPLDVADTAETGEQA